MVPAGGLGLGVGVGNVVQHKDPLRCTKKRLRMRGERRRVGNWGWVNMIDSSPGCRRKGGKKERKKGGEIGLNGQLDVCCGSPATRQDQTLSYANVHWDHMEPLKGVN